MISSPDSLNKPDVHSCVSVELWNKSLNISRHPQNQDPLIKLNEYATGTARMQPAVCLANKGGILQLPTERKISFFSMDWALHRGRARGYVLLLCINSLFSFLHCICCVCIHLLTDQHHYLISILLNHFYIADFHFGKLHGKLTHFLTKNYKLLSST